MFVRQAMVLCGGLGTRLGPLTRTTPKPLLMVGGKPFLDILLFELGRHGIRDIILLASFHADKVRAYASTSEPAHQFGMDLRVVVEKEPAGTGGALFNAREVADEFFFLLNGDSWLDTNLLKLVPTAAQEPEVSLTMALREIENAGRYETAVCRGNRVVSFKARSNRPEAGLINAGVYLFKRTVLDYVSSHCSLEKDVLPRLCADGLANGVRTQGFFIDIGVPESFAFAQSIVARRLRRSAVFLDRDGVLNVDHGYVGQIERFQWNKNAIAAIAALNDAGHYVFVITNQAGVAHGYYTEHDVQKLHCWMQQQLLTQGAHVDDIRYCPYHPNGKVAKYRKQSKWRKPGTGMIDDLTSLWGVNVEQSHLIGDQTTDIRAANAAGLTAHHFQGGDLLSFVKERGLC